MKIKIIVIIMLITASLFLLNCPNKVTTPDNSLNNSNTTTSTNKSTEAATAINNVPDFNVKLPASLAANNKSITRASVTTLGTNGSGFKSSSYGDFQAMIRNNKAHAIDNVKNMFQSYANESNYLPLNHDFIEWDGESAVCYDKTGYLEYYWEKASGGYTNYMQMKINQTNNNVIMKYLYNDGNEIVADYIERDATAGENIFVEKYTNDTHYYYYVAHIADNDIVTNIKLYTFWNDIYSDHSNKNEYFAFGNDSYGGIKRIVISANYADTNITLSYYNADSFLVFEKYINITNSITNNDCYFEYPFNQLKLIDTSIVMLKTNLGGEYQYWIEPTGGNGTNDQPGQGDDIDLNAQYLDFSYTWLSYSGTNTITNTTAENGEEVRFGTNYAGAMTNFVFVDGNAFTNITTSVDTELNKLYSTFKISYSDYSNKVNEVMNIGTNSGFIR